MTKFKVGQIWRDRAAALADDWWKIVIITTDTNWPVIAQHNTGAVESYSLGGMIDPEENETSMGDLVTLVKETP